MKKLIALFLASYLTYGCIQHKTELIVPQTAQKAQFSERNLKPTIGEKPDLVIYSFVRYGSITGDASNYYIPFSVKENNIGTANDVGAYADSLKVYQKIPIAFLLYNYRLVGTYLRPVNIPINGSYGFVGVARFPRTWRPSSGSINLVIKADGANTIAELNETNNYSTAISGILLP